jgi:hypothetical protein
MSYRIVEFIEDHIDAVQSFNERLRAGNVEYQFPENTVPVWLPPDGELLPNQRYYVVLDERNEVRGAYILKHQAFKIGSEYVSITDLRLPLSEGIVDRNFARLGVEILFNALGKQKLLFGMGIGGESESVAQLFKAGGWRISQIPFFFKVVHPFTFCRKIRFLRRTAARRFALDVAAFSGIAYVATHSVQRFRTRNSSHLETVQVELVDQFDNWADQLWDSCCEEYPMIAVRNAMVLNRLYSPSDPRFARLKISVAGQTLGWCLVLATTMHNHKHFGNLRLGSIVDALSKRADASQLIQAATDFLTQRNVDLIISNQGHEEWASGFRANGFFEGPSNYLFATSKQLTRKLEDTGVPNNQYYLNRGDGDGPINL